MAVYDHEDQEQLDELKAWWKQNGNRVTNLLLVVAVLLLAWQGWNWWQRDQSAKASGAYGALQMAVSQNDAKAVKELTGELVDKYSSTSYAGMGVLLAAKMEIDNNDTKTARMQLTWATQNAKDDAVRDLARLRVAALMLDEKTYDDALAQLSKEALPQFAPRLNELKGDVLLAQSKADDARAAYLVAVNKLDALPTESTANRATYREVLRIKLESLGGKAPVVKRDETNAGKEGAKS